MRTKQEINRAVAILNKKADRISLLQAATLEAGRSESWVFATYVTSVPEAAKDEAAFYACRDAARFAAGRLTLEELIPDAEKYPVEAVQAMQKKERQKVSYAEYQSLQRQVKVLEGLVDELMKERRQRSEYQKLPDTGRADFISQLDATEYVGCSRETLGAWQRKGLITGYRKAGRVYYSKSELAGSTVVQNFRKIK